jgi:RHS repeat-associated protein
MVDWSNPVLAVFFGSKRIGTFDRLGSAKYNQNNAAQSFYPYGEDRGTMEPNDSLKFATYTRDAATGLDYADQRYYASNFGRFMSPDRYRAGHRRRSVRPGTPTSWNRYAYVLGDPINLADPRGRDECDIDGGECGPDTEIYYGDDSGISDDTGDDQPPDPPDDGCTEDGCPDPPLAPVVQPPAPPPCTDNVQLWTWSWGGALGRGLGVSHSYIRIIGSGQTIDAGTGSMVVTVEGNQVQFAGKSILVGQAVAGAGIPSDTEYAGFTVKDGPPLGQTIPCAEANALEAAANNFNPVPYALRGYNSNSFMHWFLNLAGWVQYYANTPAENGIGWNAFPIPGN